MAEGHPEEHAVVSHVTAALDARLVASCHSYELSVVSWEDVWNKAMPTRLVPSPLDNVTGPKGSVDVAHREYASRIASGHA